MRWKNFIPFVIIVAAGTILYLFFLDGLICMGIRNLGSSAAGAKVEVRKAHFDLLKLSIQINDLKVGNKKDEFRNLFEAGRIKFALQPLPLFRKKYIIDEMSVEGVKWNTARKTSCRIPEKKKKKSEEGTSETGEVKSEKPSFLQNLASKVDVKQLVDVNKLSAVTAITGMKADIDTRAARWQQELAAKDLKAEAEAIGKTVSEVKIGQGMSIEDAKNAVTKLGEAKASLDRVNADLNAKRTAFDSDYKAVTGYSKTIDELKQLDLKKMMGEMTGGIEPKGIAKTIIGPAWTDRINGALFWVDKGRKMMPKKAKIKPPKRSKGTWVTFQVENQLPGFLIKKILLTGEAPNGAQFSGTVLGITSSPSVYGAPTIIDIKAWFPNLSAEKTFARINAVLDHTTKEAVDNFTILCKNLPIQDLSLGKSDILPSTLHIGSADIDMKLTLREKMLDSGINLSLNSVGFTSSQDASAQNEFAKIVADTLKTLGRVSCAGRIYGPMDSLKFEMSSSMDSLLSQKFNEAVGKRLREEEEKLRAELDKAVDQGKKEVQAKVDDMKSQVQQTLDSYKASLDSQMQACQAKLDEAKKQGEAFIDQEKKKAEQELQKKGEELKNQAADKLKGLFGK